MNKQIGWEDYEILLLKNEIIRSINNKCPLSEAFENVSNQLGRNKSSVRNYYYTILRKKMLNTNSLKVERRHFTQFDLFTKKELDNMLTFFVRGISDGKSVRSCALELANGDKSLMLRYQNKYRSMQQRHTEEIEKKKKELIPINIQQNSIDRDIQDAYDSIRNIYSSTISQLISSLNFLHEKKRISETFRKDLICAKAMLIGETEKMNKAIIMVNYYKDKLFFLINEELPELVDK